MGGCTLIDLRHLGGIDVVHNTDFEMFKTWMLRKCWWERER